jgi:hypothetical protein
MGSRPRLRWPRTTFASVVLALTCLMLAPFTPNARANRLMDM